jgi:hypothetical protein
VLFAINVKTLIKVLLRKHEKCSSQTFKMGHSRNHPYLLHGGNWKSTPSAPFGCPNTILLSETNISPLPLWIVEISSVGGSLDLFRNNPMHFFSTRS